MKDREAWHATVHGVAKSRTWLGDSATTWYSVVCLNLLIFSAWHLGCLLCFVLINNDVKWPTVLFIYLFNFYCSVVDSQCCASFKCTARWVTHYIYLLLKILSPYVARCFKIKLFRFLCALLKSTYLATLILTLPLKAQTWRSPPPISGRTVTCLGDEFEWILFSWGKVCLSTWKLLWPFPPSSMPIPDLTFCLWDGSSSFGPQTCALTCQWLQNTAQPRRMTGSGEAGQRIFLSVGCAEWGVGARLTGFYSSYLGSIHTQSWLPGSQAHPFLICTESCLPLKVGTHQVCSIPLMQKAGCPKFCVSVLISGWVESPQRSASSQLWSPWITPCPSVLREMNEWRVAHRGFSILISLRPSLFPPSSTHSEDALPFSDLDPTAGSLGLGTGILPPVFPSGGTGGLWSHPAPRKGWLQGLCRAGRWGYFMTQEDVTGRK